MSDVTRQVRNNRPPGMLRRILGWTAVIAGLLMLVLPGPGFLALALGIILLGRRDPTLRRWAIRLRLALRDLSRARQPHIRAAGGWLRARHRSMRSLVQAEVERHVQGQPLSWPARIVIGLTAVMALLGLGFGAAVLLF